MPLYDYRCETCGDFRDWQAMSRSQEPADCPICGNPADRRIASPFLFFLPTSARIAHARNEMSADEPTVMSRAELAAHGGHLGHGHGLGHDHASVSSHGPERALDRSPKRWMVGH